MIDEEKETILPKVELYSPIQGLIGDVDQQPYYEGMLKGILKRVIPGFCDSLEQRDTQTLKHWFSEAVPFVSWSEISSAPTKLSFYLISFSRKGVFKFFYEMISRWLVPGHRIDVSLFFAIDFKVMGVSSAVYTACEVVLNIKSIQELGVLISILPVVEAELRLGVRSWYHAAKIIEVKGLQSDVKTAMIQEHIVSLIYKRSKMFNSDILLEMQYFLVACNESFKRVREYRHMSRIIATHYLFRKRLREDVERNSQKRFLRCKVLKTNLYHSGEKKRVLSLLVGVNFLGKNELFEEKHILKAVITLIENVKVVKESFFVHREKLDSICTLYVEIEKLGEEFFSLDEVKLLNEGLADALRDHIEQLVQPIFMPRNEEEVIKNILLLANQLKYVNDLPQVMITFDEQTDEHLSFTVILLRVLKGKVKPIDELFKPVSAGIRFVHEQSKVVGKVRKRYPKEANVFRLQIGKEDFFRTNNSLDFYRARQEIYSYLENIIGEVRDFNGGLISKQNEKLNVLKNDLGDIGNYNLLLLENFFYSITPSIMRNLLEVSLLKGLFSLFLKGANLASVKDKSKPSYYLIEEKKQIYVLVVGESCVPIEELKRLLLQANFPLMSIASALVLVDSISYVGFVAKGLDSKNTQIFIDVFKSLPLKYLTFS